MAACTASYIFSTGSLDSLKTASERKSILCSAELTHSLLVELCPTDFTGAWQGVLLGMSNTAGVLAGVLGTAATGFILQNGKFLIHILHSIPLFSCT